MKGWLYNHAKAWGDKPKVVYRKKWTWKTIVAFTMKLQVEAKVKGLSGHEPGHQLYLAAYQQGLSQVCDGLSEEEREKAKRQADQWNNESSPLEVQRQ